MQWMYVVGLLFVGICVQASPGMAVDRADSNRASGSARGGLSPSAPINLTYRVDGNSMTGQPVTIALEITTPLTSGALLVEVAKQEGATVLGETARRMDLAAVSHPIALPMQAMPLGTGDHYLVLLMTVDTPMGPMSRSFRVDLTPAATNTSL